MSQLYGTLSAQYRNERNAMKFELIILPHSHLAQSTQLNMNSTRSHVAIGLRVIPLSDLK